MNTTVEQRAMLTQTLTEGLAKLPAHEGLAIAIGVIINYAKKIGMTRVRLLKAVYDCWDPEECERIADEIRRAAK